MTIRNLDQMFHPNSVVLIGASRKSGSVGNVLMKNLLGGGFSGKRYCVHPSWKTMEGAEVFERVEDLPEAPDLAIIATARDTVASLIQQLSARGTRAVVVISAGFAEMAEEGAARQQELLDAARPNLMRIIGPNSLGILLPRVGINASFAHLNPLPGNLAFVAQSGAVLTSVIDWANARNIGFSRLISLGDMADVDFGDMLDELANDPETDAILMYAEAFTSARKFMSAARAAARRKPVIAVKGGRFAASAKAATSHTGAMVGADDVYDAAMRRAGIVRVDSLEDLFAAAELLASKRKATSGDLTIVTNGGGLGVMATDQLLAHGGQLSTLSEETLACLDEVLPAHWSHGNPVDIIGDANGERYRKVLEILLARREVGAVLVLNCPTGVASGDDAAQALLQVAKKFPDRTLLSAWVGDLTAEAVRRKIARKGVPSFAEPGQAVKGFLQLQRYEQVQENLLETPTTIPEDFVPDRSLARALVEGSLRAGREWMHPVAVRELFEAYGIAVHPMELANNPAEAGAFAEKMAGPVALKLLSPNLVHKTDAGLVALNLQGAESVECTAKQMIDRVKREFEGAQIDGFIVEPMLARTNSVELIVGSSEDPVFGPTILFGQGGTRAELIQDKALSLPPLTMHLALDQMRQTRVWRLLTSHRGDSGANLDAIALTLIKLSQLVADNPEIKDAEVNPLIADAKGVVALDIRCRLSAQPKPDRLAIRPYPSEMEEEVARGDGRVFWLRPIVPEDEPVLVQSFSRLDAEDIRMRFFAYMKSLPHRFAARLCQIDYDREIALALTDPGQAGHAPIYAVVRLYADPDNENAEFAIVVDAAVRGNGFGELLMRRIIQHARERGVQQIFGEVLAENKPMRQLCRKLGFHSRSVPGEPGVVSVTLDIPAS